VNGFTLRVGSTPTSATKQALVAGCPIDHAVMRLSKLVAGVCACTGVVATRGDLVPVESSTWLAA
jgi:hypothetical protein